MKKYNSLIVVSVLFYILTALTVSYFKIESASKNEKMYKVEINRVYSRLSKDVSLGKLDLRGEEKETNFNAAYLGTCEFIKKLEFLPMSVINGEEAMDFFEAGNRLDLEIRPLYENGQLFGLLRFDIREPDFDMPRVVFITQMCLFLMELFVIGILLYLKYRLIYPFLRMSSLPHEMAQGHLQGIIKEEKNRYFGQFLWGLGQLKDTLEVTKRRKLELEKEKKKLLLSLSHDIKTPLNTIKLYAKALEEGLYIETGQKLHAFRQIGVKAVEIEGYVEEIMKNSREDILDIQVEKGEFYLSDLMKKVLDTYGEKCGIRMVELLVEKFEDRLLTGDLERSLEVFENIFENAMKYGDGKKIEITFYEEDYCQLIRIFNTGEAVSDNDLNHIFESFFRGGNSSGKQGIGLGLYICREIMRKMDGEIFAEKEGNGMAFILVFR